MRSLLIRTDPRWFPLEHLPRFAATDCQSSSSFVYSRVNHCDEIIEQNIRDMDNLMSIRIYLQDTPAPAHYEQRVVKFPLRNFHLTYKFNDDIDSAKITLQQSYYCLFSSDLAIPNHYEISICCEDTDLRLSHRDISDGVHLLKSLTSRLKMRPLSEKILYVFHLSLHYRRSTLLFLPQSWPESEKKSINEIENHTEAVKN